jgi:L-erythro-3,5-diaminohexanoate dehydrogenase
MELIGDKYGTHRVVSPLGTLPQSAEKISNDFSTLYDNEIICDVISLNIDSASFTQIEKACDGDKERIKAHIMQIVEAKGKMQNPVTGSGGMFIGVVSHIGEKLTDCPLKVGDRIASLVSLSLTPLKIEKILDIHSEIDRVDIQGKAVLFESGLYAVLPTDMPENLALAALDVAGAPAQTNRLVKSGDKVLVLGAAGKSGILVCYEAKKRAGAHGLVVGLVRKEEDRKKLLDLGIVDDVIIASATEPADVLKKALKATGGKEYDLSINCVNIQNTEMSSILPVRSGGTVYFFSMATSFTKAALGAEGVGKDINMVIGNGYAAGHAQLTLDELRENPRIREIFEKTYM